MFTKREERIKNGWTLEMGGIVPNKEMNSAGCIWDAQNQAWLAPSKVVFDMLMGKGAAPKRAQQVLPAVPVLPPAPKFAPEREQPQDLLGSILEATKASLAGPAAVLAQAPRSGFNEGSTSRDAFEVLDNKQNTARAEAQLKIATDGGFSIPETGFALGTAVVQMGVDNGYIKRVEHNAKPKVKEGCERIIARVDAERRRDAVVAVSKLSIDPKTGDLLGVPGLDSVVSSPRGWAQLLNLMKGAPYHAAAYTANLPADWRSHEFERIKKASNGREVTLRLRYPGGRSARPEHFSTVTDRYSPFGVKEGCQTIIDMVDQGKLSGDLRLESHYRGGSAKLSLCGFTDVKPENFVCGEIFSAGLGLRLSDDKSSGNSGWAEFIRNLCLNLLCLGVGKAAVFSVRHIGSAAELEQALIEGLHRANETVQPFLDMWGMARKQSLDALDLIATVKRLTAAEDGAKKAEAYISIPGVDAPLLMNWILEAHRLEPEMTKAGLVNAVSRTPQVGKFPDAVEAEAILASAAGRILEMVELPRYAN